MPDCGSLGPHEVNGVHVALAIEGPKSTLRGERYLQGAEHSHLSSVLPLMFASTTREYVSTMKAHLSKDNPRVTPLAHLKRCLSRA